MPTQDDRLWVRRARVGAIWAAGLAMGGLYAFQDKPAAAAPPLLGPITSSSLQGHVSFLASDTLEGRGTPSRGQDLAAEYIAAQFRRAGLEPVNRGTYYQWAPWPLDSSQPYAQVRNVAGVLRGSDPELRNTYVLVTAHYDHLGIGLSGSNDTIYNGANDNGSGTAAVIELASALASGKRPKRSIMFLCFFGEELGLLGSKFYCAKPIVPLSSTVANVNLEQLGRYDAPDGMRPGSMNVTGFDYSTIGPLFAEIGGANGVEVYRDGPNSDSFFARSDNQAFANFGIPAHTFSTALEYGDYHRTTDDWQKLDYGNMARVVKVIGLGIVSIANAAEAPEWNTSHPQGAKYASLRRGG